MTMSTAIWKTAAAVRLPVRHWSMIELLVLDGELEVLHVLVVLLELQADLAELLVGLGQQLAELG